MKKTIWAKIKFWKATIVDNISTKGFPLYLKKNVYFLSKPKRRYTRVSKYLSWINSQTFSSKVVKHNMEEKIPENDVQEKGSMNHFEPLFHSGNIRELEHNVNIRRGN